MQVDFNCDMGESFGPWKMGMDEEMIRTISSANIAGGFHAGDPRVMRQTVEMAKRYGVAVGIHCGFPDRVGFGRRFIRMTPEEIRDDFLYQLGALREFARYYGMEVQHVKPHGALYMMAAESEEISLAIIDAIRKVDPGLILYCMEASCTYRLAKERGLRVAAEFYADREYRSDGQIVFTRGVDRELDAQQIARRVLRGVKEGRVTTVEGEDIEVAVDTVCVHGDTPGAVRLARTIAQVLRENGVEIVSFQDRT